MKQTIFYTTNGRLDAESTGDVDAMLGRLGAIDEPRLLLFVHGGLVPEGAGVATAFELMSAFAPLVSEGWETGFPIWRSGIGETIRINQDELAREPRFVRLLLRLVEWVDRRSGSGLIDKALLDAGVDANDAAAALAALEDGPRPDTATLEARLAADGELGRAENVEGLTDQHLADTALAQALMADSQLVALLEADLPMMDGEVRARAHAARLVPTSVNGNKAAAASPAAWVVLLLVVRAGYRVLKRCLTDRDHGLGPTIVEELIGALYLDQAGAAAWGTMKQDARQHFDPGGAGTRLLEGLSAIARDGKPVRLLTIGHSAGSLFAGQLAREAARAPANMQFDHILLAPAIRLDEAAANFGGGRVNGFRLFTMNDMLERANHLDDTVFGTLYHRSLLYLISGALERRRNGRYADAPLLGLERHLAPRYRPRREERATLDAATRFFDAADDRLIFSRSPAGAAQGRTTGSAVHGGYWRDPQTLDSIRWIARNGFSG